MRDAIHHETEQTRSSKRRVRIHSEMIGGGQNDTASSVASS